ncbi:hypothetical protein Moror_8125 [Moniliophthora roreri MCA 2997]|uniref:Uncharacterized protein n=2 Tax=Moniliophthora roreri TaxID=221103 RepID=V2XL50_MONRO|nr:hypothetical protein Moror_8125 [Moniliophthora roreri MCA 2997]
MPQATTAAPSVDLVCARMRSHLLGLDYSTSLSSLAPSLTNQSTLDTPIDIHGPGCDAESYKKKRPRRLSLQLTFLRSRSAQLQPDQSANLVLSDYADITHTAMYNSSHDDDRPTNRFYRFITRSRSRSRTKNPSTSGHDVPAGPSELAHDIDPKESHSRDSSWSSRGRSSRRSSSKPSTILPSRPLSSTTTATNTTITPSTPKAKRRLGTSTVPEEAQSSTMTTSSQENAHPPVITSRPTTPKQSSGTRRKLRNIFGISSRKSSVSSSRGTSPGYSNAAIPPTDVPPVPQHPHILSHDIPRSQSPEPASSSRPHSPSPASDPLASSFSTTTSSSSKLDHIAKFFHSNTSRSKPNATGIGTSISKPRRSSTASLSTPPSSTDSISGPTKRKRTSTDGHHHRGVHIYAPQPRSATLKEPSNGSGCGSNGHGTVPRISYTPPTPNRPATTPPKMPHRNESMDSSYRHRPLLIVNEEKERESSIGDSKGQNRDASTASKRRGSDASDSRTGSKMKPGLGGRPVTKQVSIRATKHGSFDFEKPGWSTGGIIARSASGNSGSRYNRSGESLGSAGEGQHPKAKVLDTPEKKSANGTPTVTFDAWKRQRPHRTPPLKTVPLHSEDSNHRGSGKGHSSSLGKSAGKRTMGVGVTRLVGLAHGPFSFEPAVPSPTGVGELQADRKETWTVGHAKEGGLLRSVSVSTRSKVSTAETFLPPTTNGTSRPGGRGRSLDLGLGLSWAPSKVKEDVLLPIGSLASGKSSSASSRRGLTRHIEEEDERTRIGQEVAEMFKKVLDEDAFIAFKHYVHQFDAHEIPFDGPNGIIARAERLLGKASSLGNEEQQALLNKLIRVILHNA